MKKAGTPAISDLLLRENTPLPYPEVDLRESDNEAEEGKGDEGEEEEVQAIGGDEAVPVLTPVNCPSALIHAVPVDSTPTQAEDLFALVDPVPAISAPPTETQ